ncbi:hypothetical protein B0H13DRAFT_162041 [Mycena leptocephala]|nr:hypothetical protein B0H13DRAFT_162041 [Mycena leptocephala]
MRGSTAPSRWGPAGGERGICTLRPLLEAGVPHSKQRHRRRRCGWNRAQRDWDGVTKKNEAPLTPPRDSGKPAPRTPLELAHRGHCVVVPDNHFRRFGCPQSGWRVLCTRPGLASGGRGRKQWCRRKCSSRASEPGRSLRLRTMDGCPVHKRWTIWSKGKRRSCCDDVGRVSAGRDNGPAQPDRACVWQESMQPFWHCAVHECGERRVGPFCQRQRE